MKNDEAFARAESEFLNSGCNMEPEDAANEKFDMWFEANRKQLEAEAAHAEQAAREES